MSFPAPNPERIGPPRDYDPGINGTPIRIINHSTVSACVPGGAAAICHYFMSPAAGGSAHYCVDPDEVKQSVWDADEAWHAPGAAWSDFSHPFPANVRSWGVEMCDIPGPVPSDPPGSARWKALKRSWRWAKKPQRRMLRRTALLNAQLCLHAGIPPTFLGVKELKAGRHGISTHANVSAAFHQTDHWDPGWWPRRHFMKMVRAYVAKLRAGAKPDDLYAAI